MKPHKISAFYLDNLGLYCPFQNVGFILRIEDADVFTLVSFWKKKPYSAPFFGENFPLWEKGGKKVGQELLCQVIKAPFLKSPTPSPLLYCGHKAKAHFLYNKLNYWVV